MATELQYTSLDELKSIYDRLSATYKSGVTRPVAYRRKQLIQLARLMQDNQNALEEAQLADLGKPRFEVSFAEVSPVIQSALHAIEHVEEWARPEKPEVEAWRSSWDTTVYKVPKGVALIISPYNYPYILSFNPMIGAIAAGCPVVLKPSEAVPNCAALLAKLLPKYLDPNAYAVVNGGPTETTTVLGFRWAHIFFTGGIKVGQIVATAAAKHITPVTLELGGKSPVIVDTDCDVDLAAKRTLYGKLQNIGQLCVSPDYVLVPRSIAPAFRESLAKWHKDFWPETPLHPSSQWGKMVNSAHYKRVKGLIERSNGQVILGGDVDEKRISLTVVSGVSGNDSLMQEENFGPVLPIIEVENVDEAIEFVAERPIPLVLYAFTRSEETKQKLIEKTNSGRLALNDTFTMLAAHEIPFGGHGHSGYGSYYGQETFETFTHRRGFTNVPPEMEPAFGLRYPPYTEEKYKAMTAGVHTPIPKK
ncbi:unnamed protein product [Somion occarium]|uniref:Aldehyde dehydrogenase n=1 Tax=Somion occarium TaxID=3059160 RepID=A0ABP1DNP7_9APHY